jgi:uncharacterized protein (DUF58 family)
MTTDLMTFPLLEPALLERVKRLSLVARRVVEGALHGLHQSTFHGLSVEFVQYREYSPGDELKYVDWQVLARSDRYVIKQFREETNLRGVVVLDCSRSMAYGGTTPAVQGETASDTHDSRTEDTGASSSTQGTTTDYQSKDHSKFHYGRVLAAALSYLLLQQGDSVGLFLTSERIEDQVAPRAAGGHIMSICHTLQRAEPAGKTDLASVITQLAVRLQRRSLVLLISDLFDDPDRVLSALAQLHHRGHEVIVFQVLDPQEINFGLGLAARGVTVIRDMETGKEFEAEPALVRDLVRAEVQRFLDYLDAGVRRHGLHLQRCSTNERVEVVLSRYLQRRGARPVRGWAG